MSNSTAYGYAKDGKIYLNAYMDFPEREIGVVKESEEASLEYFVKRFELAEAKIEILQEAIVENQNKGSFLMKLIHMRTYLANFDGLGDFPALFAELDKMEEDIREYIKSNRKKNLEIKQALLHEANNFKNTSNWNLAGRKFRELKLKWIKTGAAIKDFDEELNKEFDEALEYFYQRRNKYLEEKRRILEERSLRYQQIIDRVRDINRNPSENDLAEIKSLQSEWRTVGTIAKKNFIRLFRYFKSEIETFYEKIKRRSNVLRKVAGKLPIEQKHFFCEYVEKLTEPDNGENVSIEEVKSIQAQWKKLGKLQHPMDREYNTRFKIACNEIFETFFLMRTARWKFPNFDDKTKFEQIKIQIRLLKDSIKEDETELSLITERHRFGNRPPQGSPEERAANLKRINQINKLKTKNRILRKLQDQLLANY